MRHKRVTLGKVPVKHSSTLVDNTGAGVGSFFSHVIYVTDVGARNTAGSSAQVIKDSATIGNICNVGDLIKYVNICLQCSPRGADPTNDNDNAGWLEWAVVWQEERDTLPTVANIGVSTLASICTAFYRGNVLMTGCFPLGTKQAMSSDLKIKLPRKACRLRVGAILQVICYVRTSLSTDTRTDSHRLIASSIYKAYS